MLKKLLLCVVGLAMNVSMVFAAVNINNASEKELESLPNIGTVRAKAIVDYRKKNGDFKSLDDLKKVEGIGDKTFAEMKGHIALTGATTPVAAAKAKEAKDEKKADKKVAKEDKPATKEANKDAVKNTAKDTKESSKAAVKEVKAEKKADKQAEKAADKPAEKAKK